MTVSPELATDDQAEVEEWGDDDFPLTIRLARLARSFARHAPAFTPEQRQRVLEVLEWVLSTGSQSERDAVATGFFEALLAAADTGFDLHLVWNDLGPESRAYCVAWNEFTGVQWP